MRDDISVVDGLVLCDSRIVIPTVTRERTLNSIHDGHQGEIKCKLRAKDAVYWPGIYKDIEDIKTCQRMPKIHERTNAQTKCPMVKEEIPPHPWHTLGADLLSLR